MISLIVYFILMVILWKIVDRNMDSMIHSIKGEFFEFAFRSLGVLSVLAGITVLWVVFVALILLKTIGMC